MWLDRLAKKPDPEFEALHRELGRECITLPPFMVDISFRRYMFALRSVFMQDSKEEIESKIEAIWNSKEARSDDIMVGLSVRSIFDLWLTAKNFPPKSQIIMTAINIPDMTAVLRHHKLVPIPVDINMATCEPNLEDIKRNINEKTVAILAAHIYGCRYSMEPILALAKQHKLMVIEDLAEAFAGLDYTGHPEADLALFSFGSIKTATALGGGIGRIKDHQVFLHMRLTLASYPTFTRIDYLKKIMKLTPLIVTMHSRLIKWLLFTISYQLGLDYQTPIVSWVRGFPKDKLMQSLRRQPPVAMLRVLERSLKEFSLPNFQKFVANVDAFVLKLRQAGIQVPGVDTAGRSYWLFPIVVDDAKRVQKALECLGVSASVSATQLQCTPIPEKSDLLPQQTVAPVPVGSHLIKHVLYLPVVSGCTPRQLDRIADCVIAAVKCVSESPGTSEPLSKL